MQPLTRGSVAVALALALPAVAGAQTFRWCDDVLPNCTTVTLDAFPFPFSDTRFDPPTYMLEANSVHVVGQLTVHDPAYGDVYLGPYGFQRLMPEFWPGGGGFYDADEFHYLTAGNPIDTEGTSSYLDQHIVRGPVAIRALEGQPFGCQDVSCIVRFTPLSGVAPEPSTVALLAGGLTLGAAALGRRRRVVDATNKDSSRQAGG